MTRYWEALALSFTVLSVAHASSLWIFVPPLFLWIAWMLRAHLRETVPAYKKSIAYLAILPFSLWWVAAPSPSGTFFSPWLLIIPSWYFVFLALWQWRGLFKGGFPVFVRWNILFVLMISLRAPDKIQVGLEASALIFLLLSSRTNRGNIRFIFAILLSSFLAVAFLFGFQKVYEWQRARIASGAWEERYRNERSMMGFSPVASLGSFVVNYNSERNSEIVLRLWTKNPPKYFRGIAYGNYAGGIWKLPEKETWVLPESYIGDHAIFFPPENPKDTVWVQATLNTFGYAFSPLGAGVAYRNADSIIVFSGRTFQSPGTSNADWYYVENANEDNSSGNEFLHVSPKLDSLFLEASKEIGLDSSMNTEEIVSRIGQFMASEFSYSLHVRNARRGEPLHSFWKYREGFCEYFASFSTLLLRKQGIPARYVVGFSAPEIASTGDYSVFRRNRSHAWVEFFDGKKWKIFDPTPPAFFWNDENRTGFSERLRARLMYWTHILRDGSWRSALDSWSSFAENAVKDYRSYLILSIFILGIFIYRMRKRFLKRNALDKNSLRIRELQMLLARTEKALERLGFFRESGETVKKFSERIQKLPVKESKRSKMKTLVDALAHYEANRWTEIS